MPKTHDIVSIYAEKGAALRLLEIEEERQSILRRFPRLKGKAIRVFLPSHIIGKKVGDVIKREKPKGPENTSIKARRYGMTAQARKAVSVRMRKYWAERRTQKAKASKKR